MNSKTFLHTHHPSSTPLDTKLGSIGAAAGDKRGTRILNQFTVRNGYGFINRNDSKGDGCTQETHITKKPKNLLLEVEFDIVKEKGGGRSKCYRPCGVPVQDRKYNYR